MHIQKAREIFRLSMKMVCLGLVGAVIQFLNIVHVDWMVWVTGSLHMVILLFLFLLFRRLRRVINTELAIDNAPKKFILSLGHDGWWVIDGGYDEQTESSIVATFRPSAGHEAMLACEALNGGAHAGRTVRA